MNKLFSLLAIGTVISASFAPSVIFAQSNDQIVASELANASNW